jgi:hypothetical protein
VQDLLARRGGVVEQRYQRDPGRQISHYLNLALHEGVPFGPDLVVRGSLERLTPVLSRT